jgi:hypothetical protein
MELKSLLLLRTSKGFKISFPLNIMFDASLVSALTFLPPDGNGDKRILVQYRFEGEQEIVTQAHFSKYDEIMNYVRRLPEERVPVSDGFPPGDAFVGDDYLWWRDRPE